MSRAEALRLHTVGSSWFSTEEGRKGALVPGQLADLALLSADYFTVPDEDLRSLESVLTIVDGTIVYAAAEFQRLGPPPLRASPDWSPVNHFGGHARAASARCASSNRLDHSSSELRGAAGSALAKAESWVLGDSGLWTLGCDCLAF